MRDFKQDVKLAEEIGRLVEHSTRTLLLSPYGGRALKYHGQFSGDAWPTLGDINAEKLVGMPQLSIEARFNELNNNLQADYFIITNFEEFEAQENLKEYLTTKFPSRIKKDDDYLIFDLRKEPYWGRPGFHYNH